MQISNKIQFGCGGNKLPDWINVDQDVNIIRPPLPFEKRMFEYVFCEHLIEHVTSVEALRFLKECNRIMKPNGVIRIAFPDMCKLNEQYTEDYLELCNKDIEWDCISPKDKSQAVEKLITGYGHKSAWAKDLMCVFLQLAGFEDIKECNIGESEHHEFKNIEMHHRELQHLVAMETTVMEAKVL